MSAEDQTPHLTDSLLRALITQEEVVTAEVGTHFVTCPTCQARAWELEPDRTGWVLAGLDHLGDLTRRGGPASLASLNRVHRLAALRRAETAELVERLAEADDPERLLRDSDADPLFLAASVLQWALAVRQDDPRKILRLCNLAMDCLTAEPGAETRVPERAMLAQLKAEAGNAHRILAQPVQADASIAESLKLSQDCADPLAVAFILLCASSHFKDVRRFEEAERLARCSVSLYRRYGRRKEIEKAEWQLAFIPYRQGDIEEARTRLTAFLETKPEDPLCELATVAHLVRLDLMEGQAFKAGRFLSRLRELSGKLPHGSKGLSIKIDWHIALIMGGVRQLETGARLLSSVRHYYLDQGILFDAAIATVDLAYLLLKAGKKEDAADVAAEAVEAFRGDSTNYPYAVADVWLNQPLYRDLGLFPR